MMVTREGEGAEEMHRGRAGNRPRNWEGREHRRQQGREGRERGSAGSRKGRGRVREKHKGEPIETGRTTGHGGRGRGQRQGGRAEQ